MMHRMIRPVVRWFLAVLLIALTGCSEPGERLEPKGFPLHIALSAPLAGGLPKDLLELTLPFQGEGCKGLVLTPVVQVVRLDLESPKPVELKPELDWIARLQEKVHAGSLKQRRGSVERGFSRALLPAELTMPAVPMTSSAEAKLEAVLSPRAREKTVWVLNDAAAADTTRVTAAGHVFQDAATFQKEVGGELCGRAARGEELTGFYILYHPPASDPSLVGRVTPPAVQEPAPVEVALPSLAQVRQDIEDGRLGDARQALGRLRAAQPEAEDVAQLDRDLHAKLRARIMLRKPDGLAQQAVFTDPRSITVPIGAQERKFGVQVEPGEAIYLYLYGEYSDGRVMPLFSPDEQTGSTALPAGHSYLLPSEGTAYDLTREGGVRLTGLYAVTTRWRARDLERLNARLGGDDREAAEQLRNALHAREQAGLGGCDVRAVQFKLTADAV